MDYVCARSGNRTGPVTSPPPPAQKALIRHRQRFGLQRLGTRFRVETKFDHPHGLCTDVRQGIRQTEGLCRKQVFNQQSVAILKGDHNRSKWIQPENCSRLTCQSK